jgi:tRNA1Val (adenine37-N6)-methyltransferase
MANSYFKFKQFTIHQDKCAMKVCTDACLFGALVADCTLPTANCLDIGTGTGLLPLILAQKNNTLKIDAVEIDAAAAAQATENIATSPWADNIQVFNDDILNFSSVSKEYDCIISNPPFFEDDLQSADENKNNAKHSTTLNLIQLLDVVNRLLDKNGFFVVMLPYHRLDYFIEAAKKIGLHVNKQILVRQTMKHKFFRSILFFSYKQNQPEQIEIIIKDTQNNYTPQFAAALKDYYLFL